MMNFKVMPVLMLGALMGVLSMAASPARAQSDDNPLFQQYANRTVAYVGTSDQFDAAWGKEGNLVIRFVRSGTYQVTEHFHWNSPYQRTIEGPGSFYMDPSGTYIPPQVGTSTPPTGYEEARAFNYGVTLDGTPWNRVDEYGIVHSHRFMVVDDDQELTIRGVTIMNYGLATGDVFPLKTAKSKSGKYPNAFGGTIYNDGTLTLENVTIVNSKAIALPSHPKADGAADGDDPGGSALGGAIYNGGTLIMTGCTILKSSVETSAFDSGTKAMGGAVYNKGTATIKNCTFEKTSALGKLQEYNGGSFTAGGKLAAGGALANDGGTVTVTNITLTTSSAEAQGTEVEADGAYGGGVYGTSAFPLKNSFFQDTHISGGTRPPFGTTTYKSGRFVGSYGATGSGTSAEEIKFTGGSGGNHNLGSPTISTSRVTDLQDNGGTTLTRAPASESSDLVDGGVGAYSQVGTVDQRGANRILLGADPSSTNTSGGTPVVDVGAVEFDRNHAKSGGNVAPYIERNTTWTDPEGKGEIEFSEDNGNPLIIKDANDVDDEGGAAQKAIVQVTIDSPDAIVKLGNTDGITIVSQDDHHIVIRGTIEDINKALDGLTLFITDADQDYPPNFSITVDDLGNTGYGGALSYDDVSVHEYIDPTLNPMTYITPQNDPPYILAPRSGTVKWNESQSDTNKLSFSSANGNPIVVGDLDLNAQSDDTLPYDRSQLTMRVTLEVSNGILLVGDPQGQVDQYNGENGVTYEASWEILNSILDTLSYRPNAGFVGTDTLSIKVNDLGNYGEGGPKKATKSVSINVTKDGKGSSDNSTIGWFISNITTSNQKVNVTYVFINGSDTDITNFVATGSILGGAYFDTDTANISPSVGQVTREYVSPALQRKLDPSKNGLSITWTTPSNDPTKSIVIRQGRRISLTVSVPYSPQAVGQLVTGPWKVSFDKVESDGNATKPAPTQPAQVP